MMKVLVDMPVYEPASDTLKKMQGLDVQWVKEPAEKSRPLETALIKDCDILLCTFLPENHEEMSKLKLVQISSAGYKQLIGQKLEERNIKACNALGVFDIPIAEWN